MMMIGLLLCCCYLKTLSPEEYRAHQEERKCATRRHMRRLRRRWRIRLQERSEETARAIFSLAPATATAAAAPTPVGTVGSISSTDDGSAVQESRVFKFLARTQYVRTLGHTALVRLLPLTKSIVLAKDDVLLAYGAPTRTGLAAGMFLVRNGRLGLFDKVCTT